MWYSKKYALIDRGLKMLDSLLTGGTKTLLAFALITSLIACEINDDPLEPKKSVQEYLEEGMTPKDIIQKYNADKNDFYGLSYGGGLIFWISNNYDSVMVAAPEDEKVFAPWGCQGTIIKGANDNDTAIGTGLQNTKNIIEKCNIPGIAAQLCSDLKLGVYDDWFLPSINELSAMYLNLNLKKNIGSFKMGVYWSSSESSASTAKYMEFAYGRRFNDSRKGDAAFVRAVRLFKPTGNEHLSIQARLDKGSTPEMIMKEGVSAEELYGKTYQGGLIFWLNKEGTAGLLAAPKDEISAPWGCEGTTIPDCDGIAIGTGLQNTKNIIENCKTPGIAAKLCSDLDLNGYDDWFLPARNELDFLYQNLHRKGHGGMNSGQYWSSTQGGPGYSIACNFIQGEKGGWNKSGTMYVRAIRAFGTVIKETPPKTIQQQLDEGETPMDLIMYKRIPLDSFYGKTYQNGLIFYLENDGSRGMVVSPNDIGYVNNWGCAGVSINGANGKDLFDGEKNTKAIIESCKELGIAALLCVNYKEGGFNWWLPSSVECLKMQEHLVNKGHGNFLTGNYDFYWTSTQYELNPKIYVNALRPVGGKIYTDYAKNIKGSIGKAAVRAVHYF